MCPSCGTRPAWTRDVFDYVFQDPAANGFLRAGLRPVGIYDPPVCGRGEMSLVVSIGCTGGQHRSVSVARQLAQMLGKHARNVNVRHRDVARR